MDVIIPTTGKRITQLEECIVSLTKQPLQVNIIIVLGTRYSKILEKVVELCKKYNCTLLSEPYKKLRGSHRAVACNHGLQNTNDRFVAFIDDDVTVPPIWAETAIPYFKVPSIAGVTSGCRQYPSPFHRVQTIGSGSHSKSFAELTKVQSLPGYNSIYRRKAIDLVCGFSEDIGGCEDWELNYRLRKKGWKLYGIPEAPVEHRYSYTWKSFIKQMFGYGWSRSRLLRKKHIFTPQHAIPTIGLILLTSLFFINLNIFSDFFIVYLLSVTLMSISTKPTSFKSFFQTVLTFMVMHVSWAFGYLKGLFF